MRKSHRTLILPTITLESVSQRVLIDSVFETCMLVLQIRFQALLTAIDKHCMLHASDQAAGGSSEQQQAAAGGSRQERPVADSSRQHLFQRLSKQNLRPWPPVVWFPSCRRTLAPGSQNFGNLRFALAHARLKRTSECVEAWFCCF